jgi:hypothetical protein
VLFWGWGRKSLNRQLAQNQALVLTYRYFHLMFIFRAAFGYRYQLATATEQGWAMRPIESPEAEALLAGEELRPTMWARYSIFLLFVVIVVVIAASALG